MKSTNSSTLRNFVQEKKRKSSLDLLVNLSLQNDSVWYCPFITTARYYHFKTTTFDTVPSKRQCVILSFHNENLGYYLFKATTCDTVPSNKNMCYWSFKTTICDTVPFKTTTCDTIPSKRQLLILSLQNEIVWYCPFKTTTYDIVCQNDNLR